MYEARSPAEHDGLPLFEMLSLHALPLCTHRSTRTTHELVVIQSTVHKTIPFASLHTAQISVVVKQ